MNYDAPMSGFDPDQKRVSDTTVFHGCLIARPGVARRLQWSLLATIRSVSLSRHHVLIALAKFPLRLLEVLDQPRAARLRSGGCLLVVFVYLIASVFLLLPFLSEQL
jgi:hypothetical protein